MQGNMQTVYLKGKGWRSREVGASFTTFFFSFSVTTEKQLQISYYIKSGWRCTPNKEIHDIIPSALFWVNLRKSPTLLYRFLWELHRSSYQGENPSLCDGFCCCSSSAWMFDLLLSLVFLSWSCQEWTHTVQKSVSPGLLETCDSFPSNSDIHYQKCKQK